MTEAPQGDTGASAPPQYRPPETESLLRRSIDIVSDARPVPLSASSMINKEELLELLQAAADGLPDELRAARWLLKERDDFLARVQREGDQIVTTSRARAEQMVQRTEVVKSANEHARKVVSEADSAAQRLRLETEDWCDQKLGGLEVVLQRTLRTVDSGRSRLQGARTETADVISEADEQAAVDEFFDQDDG